MNRIVFLLLFILPFKISAQTPYFNELPMVYNEYTFKVNCLATNKQGYLYLGTNKGVFLFDGYKYVPVFTFNNWNTEITKLFFDSKGNLWVGDANGKINKQSKDNLNEFITFKFHFKEPVSDIVEDQSGKIWISSYGGGLVYYTADSALVPLKTTLNLYVYDMVLVNKDLWLASDQGIDVLNVSSIQMKAFEHNSILPDGIITSLAYNKAKKEVYIGTQSKGLSIYHTDKNSFNNKYSISKYGSVNKINFIGNNIWLLTEDSALVHILPEGPTKAFNKKNELFVSGITDMIADKEGNYWLCNKSNNLYSFNELFEFIPYPSLSSKNNNAIYRDKNNAIWISSNKGLFRYHNNAYEQILPQLKKKSVVSIHQDMYGDMWFGTFDKGLIRYNPNTKKYSIYTEKDGLCNNNILSIASINNTLWLATLGGICKVDFNHQSEKLGAIINFEKEKGIGINFIYQVFIDSKKRIWFATDGKGLTLYDGKDFINYNASKGLASKTIYSVTEAADGGIWVSSPKDGIYLFDGSQFRNFNKTNGIRSLDILSLVADENGNLIIMSDEGIDVLNTHTYQIHYHDEELGLRNLDPVLNASCKDLYGNIWFATSNGIIKYNHHRNKMWAGPTTILKRIGVFNKMYTSNFPKEFEYDENNISFDFIGLWYHKPSEVKYRVQLEGYDLNWFDTRDNIISYSKLLPGKYNFKVMSTVGNNFEHANCIEYEFVVKAPFWKRTWFVLLLILSFGTIIYFAIRRREKRLKEKQKFENDRIRFQFDTLRNQINPHFLFNSFNTLAGIIETDPDKAVVFVEKLSDFYRELLNYREKSVITIKEELNLLNSYIFLIEQRFADKIKIDIFVSEEMISKRMAPFCLQLLVENAIKHNTTSRENPLHIKIYEEQSYLVVQNTIRRKQEQVVSTGIGLQNIIKRYELLSTIPVEIIDDNSLFVVKIPLID